MSGTEREIEDIFNKHWIDIIINQDGSINLSQIKKELYDYTKYAEEWGNVYYKITGGALSYPNYHASAVISCNNDTIKELIENAIKEYEEDNDIKTLKEKAWKYDELNK